MYIFFIFWLQEPAAAATKRLDQLKAKQSKKKQEDPDGDGEDKGCKGRGRGRGKGYAGRGRGRGKGAEQQKQDKQSKAKAATSTEKGKKPREKADGKDKGWAAWATEDAWSQGWDDSWDREAWAWDSYAWWEGEVSAHELEQWDNLETEGSSKPAPKDDAAHTSKSKKSKRKEIEGCKEGTKDESTVKTTKSRKKATCHKKTEEEVLDQDRPSKTDKKKTPRNDKKKTDEVQETNKKKKQRRSKDSGKEKDEQDEQDEQDEGRAEKRPRRKRKKPSPAPLIPLPTDPPAEVIEKGVQIMAFMDGVKNMDPEAAKLLMRGRLCDSKTCRMNVYWNRDAVGLHFRKQRVDFAYLKPSPNPDFGTCPSHCLMAAALKAAEILVPCLFISFHLDVTYITSKHCAFQALCMCNVCSVYILKTIMDAHDTNQENYLLLLFLHCLPKSLLRFVAT